MFETIAVPAFKDNYIWLLRKGSLAVAVDPGDAAPVFAALDRDGLTLGAIIVTHHHADHQGGVAALLERHEVPVFGPASESITGMTEPLRGGETIMVEAIGTGFEVLAVPGHTLGHLAFYGQGKLLCGDTLFAGGCGRVFEGTPREMHDSLSRLASFPEETAAYCAHEYTAANLRFALAVEPGNRALQQRAREVAEARARGEATVPTTIALERSTNPFLRCDVAEVIASARREGAAADDAVSVFAALREWKNRFQG
jgi:hydroxyacylglutathione hydrolase